MIRINREKTIIKKSLNKSYKGLDDGCSDNEDLDEKNNLALIRSDKIIARNKIIIDTLDKIRNHPIIHSEKVNKNMIIIIKKNNFENYNYYITIVSKKNKNKKILDYIAKYPDMDILMTIHHHKAINFRTQLKSCLEKNVKFNNYHASLKNNYSEQEFLEDVLCVIEQ